MLQHKEKEVISGLDLSLFCDNYLLISNSVLVPD